MKNLLLLLIAALSLFLFTCTNKADEDVTPPEMTMEQPVDGETYFVGEEFHMEMQLTDNIELQSCLMEILPDQVGKSTAHEGEPWEYYKIFDFSGNKTSSIHDHIDVPDSIGHAEIATGTYKFRATCKDHAGNQTVETRNFTVSK